MDTLSIRLETPGDIQVINSLTRAAFATLEVSDHTEQYVIEALRKAGALTLSLVAEMEGQIVGHIAFSPITISDGTQAWFGLGPLSVWPDLQKKGIGKALMREGLARLQGMGAKGCCLVGHPDYYVKFGFTHPNDLSLEGVPADVFFALAFDGPMPHGSVAFHPAFFATGPVTKD